MILAAALALVASCDKSGNDLKNNPRKDIELTTKQSLMVETGNSFAFNFIDKVEAASDKDYIISPLSMQFLLGMILDGAEGQTAREISEVLGYGADGAQEVNEYCLEMLTQLPSLDKATSLSIANAIIVDKGFALKKDYVSAVKKYYQAEVSNLDFADRTGSAQKINKWCSDHTNGMIPKILDQTDPDMLAYLLNAMYFKSMWSSPFKKADTQDREFTLSGGSKKKLPMMSRLAEMRYMENKAFKAVRLNYGNGAYTMTVFLPAEGSSIADVCSYLKATPWKEVLGEFGSFEVDLWLPRFETTFHINLNDILADMGMPSSFSPVAAEFTPMSDDALCLSFVNQDAKIKVDEEGTEAAVVSSAGMMKNTSVAPPMVTKEFHAVRPFLYIISEKSTSAVLFAGRYSGI